MGMKTILDLKLLVDLAWESRNYGRSTFTVPVGFGAAAKRLEVRKLIVFNPTADFEIALTRAGEELVDFLTRVDLDQ